MPSIAEWVVGSASTANTLAVGAATVRVALTFSSATVCMLLVISSRAARGRGRGPFQHADHAARRKSSVKGIGVNGTAGRVRPAMASDQTPDPAATRAEPLPEERAAEHGGEDRRAEAEQILRDSEERVAEAVDGDRTGRRGGRAPAQRGDGRPVETEVSDFPYRIRQS